MTPEHILKELRKTIRDHASDNADKWWYTNRFVYARLQLDERNTKTKVKKKLFAERVPCHYCGEAFKTQKGVDLHRKDGGRGYSDENCVLMHPECHRKHHAENPSKKRNDGRPANVTNKKETKVLTKSSKKYTDKQFTYWWDFAPGFIDKVEQYGEVEFVQKDTGATYTISAEALAMFFTQDRRTSRGTGNWGVRVLAIRPNELAFEPGNGSGEWLMLKIDWEQ